MKAWSKSLAAMALTLCQGWVWAALDIDEAAPQFTAQAATAGVISRYSLSEELKKGPVVLYFFPMSFSADCSVEAHNFAEAIEQYRALGATVIGVSNDSIETLNKFSVSECRSKFAVAADTSQSIMKSYDAVLGMVTAYANRTSFVIATDGRILYIYSNMSPDLHVANTLAALRQWAAAKQKP